MDIEQLEKLNELKEKGLLTQEEFDKQKKALLTPEAANKAPVKNKKGVNWKNLGKSFIITLFWFLGVIFITSIITDVTITKDSTITEDKAIKGFTNLLYFLSAIGFTIIASKLETKKYKNYCPAWEIFIGVWALRELGVWIAVYEFLQIKQGNATLKEKTKAPKSIMRNEEVEKPKERTTVRCSSCNALNTVIVGEVCYCEFCGNPIKESK